MIDIKLIKEDPKRIKAELSARGLQLTLAGKQVAFDVLLQRDHDRRRLQQEIEALRGEQKATRNRSDGKRLKTEIHRHEHSLNEIERDFQELYLQLPNFHDPSTPIGPNESGNQVIKTVGSAKQPAYAKPHYEVSSIAPLIDFTRGAKVSGSRFWYLRGPLVQLQFALVSYTLDFYIKRGYQPMRPPDIVNEAAMFGTGFFPADAHETYQLHGAEDDRRQYLVGTAEVSLASYHAGESLAADALPRRYLGYSPAYRREAGSYGKDTKGIIRGHQFDKLELFRFTAPSESSEAHQEMQTDAEEFWNSLAIPYRVLNMCTGDIGAPNAKKYDLEAWLPGEGAYREVASNSNDTDFQARRLKIKFAGSNQYVHTLNNTACAIGRAIVAIVENYQRKDGTVDIPQVLQAYLPFKRISHEE